MTLTSRSAKYTCVGGRLAVAALGLTVGASGVGILTDLLAGPAHEPPRSRLISRSAGESDTARPPLVTAADVIAPAEVPDGTALTDSSAGAREARDAAAGEYVPFTPTSVRLPSGRLAPIQPATVTADGALDVPDDPERVGWWTGGAQAGEPFGSIVLAGHVDSRSYGLGVLVELRDLRAGQEVKVADGRHGQVYRVESVRAIPKAELTAGGELFEQQLKHRLVMITCGGPFDRETRRYRDNVVIVAKPQR